MKVAGVKLTNNHSFLYVHMDRCTFVRLSVIQDQSDAVQLKIKPCLTFETLVKTDSYKNQWNKSTESRHYMTCGILFLYSFLLDPLSSHYFHSTKNLNFYEG